MAAVTVSKNVSRPVPSNLAHNAPPAKTAAAPKSDPSLSDGIEMEELSADFEPIIGFLNTKEPPVSFVGILRDVIQYQDSRGKPAIWFSFESTQDQTCTAFDKENGELAIVKGVRVGVAGSGAIKALQRKKGHLCILKWTGQKIETKNGPMNQILCKVSTAPVVKAPAANFDAGDEIPF